MKISILKLIEDALIGGRNGENAFIENHPLLVQLFRESGKSFKDFLMSALQEKDESTPKQKFTQMKIKISSDKMEKILGKECLIDFYKAKKASEEANLALVNEAKKVTKITESHPLFANFKYYGTYSLYFNFKDNEWVGYIQADLIY